MIIIIDAARLLHETKQYMEKEKQRICVSPLWHPYLSATALIFFVIILNVPAKGTRQRIKNSESNGKATPFHDLGHVEKQMHVLGSLERDPSFFLIRTRVTHRGT